jgi:hypothetical protein
MQMLTKGGWDVGHLGLGEGGFVHITGRTWKIIIRGGENVAAPAAPDCPRTATGAAHTPRAPWHVPSFSSVARCAGTGPG